jgi:hypothetical protein
MRKKFITVVSGLICLLLVVLTGCQAISGIEVSKVLQNSANMKSFEGDGSLSIEFANDGTEAAPNETAAFDIASLKKLDLQITSMKMSDPDHMTVTGQLNVLNRSIPIMLQMDNAQLAIFIENSSKPVVFKLDSMIASSINLPGGFSDQLGTVLASPSKLVQLISPFIIANLPELKNVSSAAVNEKINNESMDLQKVHVELNSTEATEFVKTLLKNILASPDGLKELVTQIYGAFFVPSDFVINIICTKITDYLQGLVDSFDQKLSTTGALSFLNDQTSLKTDLYVDSSALQLRKIGLELNIAKAANQSQSNSSIKVIASAQIWNVNKTVKTDAKAVPDDAFKWDGTAKMAHLLKSLDPNSQFYQLLMNDLHVTKKEIKMNMPADNGSGVVAKGSPYISASQRTMVPVRFVSEQLDADVKWDDTKKEVTVTDILTDKKIVLTIGSTKALVDGVEATLDSPAVLTNGSTYVPVGFIGTSLGAKIGWDKDTRTVSISKN